MNLSTEKKIMDLENRLVVDQGKEEGNLLIELASTTWMELETLILSEECPKEKVKVRKRGLERENEMFEEIDDWIKKM